MPPSSTPKPPPPSQQPDLVAKTEGVVSRAQFKWAQDVFSRLNAEGGKRVSHADLSRASDILRDYTAEQATKQAGGHSEESSAPAAKKFANTIVDACIVLGIDRRTWTRWAKSPTFPHPRSDGRWSLDEVRAWAKANGKNGANDLFDQESAEEEAERGKLEVRRLRTICDRLDFEFAVRRDEFVTKVEHESTIARIAANVRRVLLPIPAGLAPQVVGLSIPDAEELLRKAVFEALEELHAGKWDDEEDEEAPWAEEANGDEPAPPPVATPSTKKKAGAVKKK